MAQELFVKRSLRLAGHRTSVALEQIFWDALAELAASKGCSLTALVLQVDAARSGNLASALRVFVIKELREKLLCFSQQSR